MEKRRKVLIIDYDVDVCLLMKAYFLRKNYEVDTTHTLNTAFQSIKEKEPAIIFLDIGLCTHPEDAVKNLEEAAPGAQLIFNHPDKPDNHFTF